MRRVLALALLAGSIYCLPVQSQFLVGCEADYSQTEFYIDQEPMAEPYPAACTCRCRPNGSGFWCHKPIVGNPVYDVQQTGDTYRVRARVLVEVPGSQQNTSTTGTNEARAKINWFDRAEVPGDQNLRIRQCGFGGFDRAYLYVEVRELTCETVADRQDRTFSFQVLTCAGDTACDEAENSKPLVLTRAKLRQTLGCPEPPKWSCGGDSNCRECITVGQGSASPAGEGASAEPDGHGAAVRYRAGGAGGPGWPGTAAWNQILGRYWSHEYAERIVPDPNDGHVWLITGHATFREFTDGNADGAYETVSPSDEYRDLVKVPAGWELRGLDGTVQSFDATGLWTGTMDRNGNETAAQYTSGKLTRVTFPDGRREDFAYHPDGKLHTITQVGVDGTTSRTWTYTWSGLDLIRIDRPDGTAWEMFYSGDSNLGGYLTRIDLRGTGTGNGRVETAWEYDAKGNVTRIWRGDPSWSGPNAVDLHVLSYDAPALPKHTEVTDALGKVSVYDMERDPSSRKPRMTSIQGDCPSCGLGPATTFQYGDSANPLLPTMIVDAKNHRTELAYNADGRLLSRIEAEGTPLARVTTWEYHPVFRSFPTRIEVPSTAGGLALRETLMAYDAEGNILTRTEQGMEDGASFALTTVMTYNAGGQVLTVDPPGHGAADVTTYAYDSTRGNGHLVPLSRTDPIVGTTIFTHDAFNRREGVVDVNGVLTVTTYDPLNRVTSVMQDGGTGDDLVTLYNYDVFGDLSRTTLPEGNLLDYDFDSAGRLQSVESRPDAATRGERTLYELDAVGHRVREDLQSWDGSDWLTESWTEFVYSTKCHLDKVIRPGGSVTEYAYDCKGNLEKVWDANHPKALNSPTQLYAYDELDRLKSLTQPWTGAGGGTAVTSYAYDVQDHLASVTDAEGNATFYTYGDRDLLTLQDSPVSGTTTYVYNEAGELEQETDAREVTVIRAYDALDRVTTVSYPDPTLDVTYTYDAPGAFANGRLTGISRHGETIVYEYDRFGRMARDGALTYGYDKNGNKTTIGYPSDVTATYTYDHAGRQETLSMTVGTDPAVALVTDAAYKPFGPLSNLSLGNGLTETRDYDPRYQPSSIRVDGGSPLLHWTYTVDPVGNITGIADQLNPANNRTYNYQDVFYYLTQGDGPWGPRAWTYDRIGNRLTEARGPETDVYSYLANPGGGHNPKLLSVAPSGGGERSYGYDESGNTVQIVEEDSQEDLIYDDAGRMAFLRSLPEEKIISFAYDGRGYLGRTGVGDGGCFAKRTFAIYNSEGQLYGREHLLSDADSSPVDSDTIVYFDGRPVGILKLTGGNSSLTFLSLDHLGMPALATGESSTSTWEGGFEPFGEDYSGAQATGIFMRFAGQWAGIDGAGIEGLYYNLYRWYEPTAGRYAKPDPLGFDGSPWNLYVYANANPLSFMDPFGLASFKNFPADKQRQMEEALQRAKDRLNEPLCCAGSIGPRLLDLLDKTTFIYEENLSDQDGPICGQVRNYLTKSIKIGSAAFDYAQCCLLEATLVHEVNHLRAPSRGSGEGGSRRVERDCFNCPGGVNEK